MLNIRSFISILLLAAIFLLPAGQLHALSLLEAYESALENDPIYRSAVHENEAGEQAKAVGLAGLLPNLSITHAQSKNTGTQKFAGAGTTPLNFDSKVSTLSLRQPLLNMEAVAGYKQGVADSNSSRARFTGHSQQLIVRLVEAYVAVLLAQDNVYLVEAQSETLKERKQVNEQMLAQGEGTVTDVLETQSQYALVQARVIEAYDEQAGAQMELAAIVGREITHLQSLSKATKIRVLPISDYDSLQELALNRNAELVMQRHTVISSKEEINMRRAGHAPRVELVASLSRNKSASFVTANRDVNLASIGVEVNIPIYAGGRVNAVTSQAVANHARAESDLNAITNGVLLELRRQYNLLLSSIKRIESLELAVASADLLVKATEKSILGGVRINLDLLDAQQQLFLAQGELSLARYNYLLAYLRLKLASGTLILEDLQNIADNFVYDHTVKINK